MKLVYYNLIIILYIFCFISVNYCFLEKHPTNAHMMTFTPNSATPSVTTQASPSTRLTRSNPPSTRKTKLTSPTTHYTMSTQQSTTQTGNDVTTQQLQQLAKRVSDLEQENLSLKTKVTSLENHTSALGQENSALKSKIGTIEIQTNNLTSISSELSCARDSVKDVQKNVDFLLQRINVSGFFNSPKPCPSVTTYRFTNQTANPRDCLDIYLSGQTLAAVYTLRPKGSLKSFKAYCEQGWTFIQQRDSGKLNFWTKKWDNIIVGFGDPLDEFWLGNDKIYQITNQANYKLRIEATGWTGKLYWAEYSTFVIDNEANKYKLHINGYSGNYKDLMADKNGTQFSTRDQNNDQSGSFSNCADFFGPWWYGKCEKSPNGIFADNVYGCMSFADRCVNKTVMKIIPNPSGKR